MLLPVAIGRILPYAMAVLAVMAVLSLSALYFYNMGYDRSDTLWELKVSQERERVRIANEEAEKVGRNLLENYRRSVRSRDATIQLLEDQIAADPASGNVCLPSRFVRGLNEIR